MMEIRVLKSFASLSVSTKYDECFFHFFGQCRCSLSFTFLFLQCSENSILSIKSEIRNVDSFSTNMMVLCAVEIYIYIGKIHVASVSCKLYNIIMQSLPSYFRELLFSSVEMKNNDMSINLWILSKFM